MCVGTAIKVEDIGADTDNCVVAVAALPPATAAGIPECFGFPAALPRVTVSLNCHIDDYPGSGKYE
jgi:hypothetical protein